MSHLVQQFAELFEGNPEAIGTEEGGCERIRPEDWLIFVKGHLQGAPPIGVYPMKYVLGEWLVKWGCIDFDEGEEQSWDYATRTYRLLKAFGATSWIERSRSKGYHVWVFARSWVPARTMRMALWVCAEGAGVPTKEVNPKQEALRPGQLGNYVRLPYPGWLADGPDDVLPSDRRIMLRVENGLEKWPVSLHEFVEEAHSSRVSPNTLDHIASYYVPPERPILRRDWSGLPRTQDGINGFVKWVAQLPEGNRNMGLYWAARECLDQGIAVTSLGDLIDAAVEAGLSWEEATRTVESALRG